VPSKSSTAARSARTDAEPQRAAGTTTGARDLDSGADRPDGRRYVVNPHLRVIRCSDDEALVVHGSRSLFNEILADSERAHLIGPMLDRLRRPASLDDLVDEGVVDERLRTAAAEALRYLAARSILTPAERSGVGAYVDAFLGDGDRLAAAAVAVVGSGALADRLGDRLRELTGREPAARAAADADEASLTETLKAATFAVVVADTFAPTLLHAANAAAIETRIPWISAYVDGSEAVVGPTYVPGETCCYYEFEMQTEASTTMIHEVLLLKEAAGGAPQPVPMMSTHLDVAGGLAVDSTLRFLTTGTAPTVGRAIRFHFERATVDHQDVLRLPRCPACGPTRAPYRHLFT
jgi:bacteriocin biosynthesis cyclodehydratase domain-containing protein